MNHRLVVLTEIIAPYRIPVFNALAAREGVSLHVIFLSKTDASTRRWRVYEDEIRFSYEVLPSWRRRVGRYNLLLNKSVTSALSAVKPDVLICGGYNYLASWQAMNWAKRNRVQFLLWSESTAYDRRAQHFPVEWLKRKFLSNCDGFVVPGQSALEYVQQFASPEQKIFVARNAVDIGLFAEKEKSIRRASERMRGRLALPPRYFLFVGRLVRSKGAFDLIEAYRAMPSELRASISLVFAGDGPMRTELEALAREIYPGCVHFPGFVHRDELASYYALAECLVMPTHTDPWGLVVNEAMACGLPVICTNAAGCAADLIRENGILVAPGDAVQLAQAMRELATRPDLRRYMAAESVKLIQEYSPEACAAGFAQAAEWSGSN
jgi:glycosyltransferase involved in cell wall biosynthesis